MCFIYDKMVQGENIMTTFNFYTILAIVAAYCFGSIPWALVVGKVFYKTDVREFGSGNLGGSNAGRVLGKGAGLSVTLLDGLKACIVVLVCARYQPEATVLAGLACCFGHCFPLFANFKGGKAVATTFGYFFGIGLIYNNILAYFFLPLAVFFTLLYISKMVSLSSILAIGFEALVSFFINSDILVSISFVILFIFVTYRHKANIQRIRNGEEKKITWM